MSEKDFEIKRTINEADIPARAKYRTSKYEPIYKSCSTLDKGEGIEVQVPKPYIRTVILKGLKEKFPRRIFSVTGRKHPDGYMLYIIRK